MIIRESVGKSGIYINMKNRGKGERCSKLLYIDILSFCDVDTGIRLFIAYSI